MALITSYLVTTKNLEPFFNSLISARAPERFTQKFLESLEFKSTNDRLYIALLKGLGFIDESGVPTSRYYEFIDQTRSKVVLATAIMEAYEDLFNINTEAYKLTEDEVKNKLRTLTQGKNSDNVLSMMAKTFKALAAYASWGSKKSDKKASIDIDSVTEQSENKEKVKITNPGTSEENFKDIGLHYNIQIHLPDTRDPAVYDALFKSLKEHLM